MPNRLLFTSSNSNKITDENDVVEKVTSLKNITQSSHNPTKNQVLSNKNLGLKGNEAIVNRKPLANKSNNHVAQQLKFPVKETALKSDGSENKKVGFNRPSLKNKKPIMVTHTGSFMVQNNNNNAGSVSNVASANGGYRIQKSLTRQKSLVLNDFEDHDEIEKNNNSDDNAERTEMMNKLRAVFNNKSDALEGQDEEEEGYVTDETDSGSELQEESFSHSMPSLDTHKQSTNNLMDLLSKKNAVEVEEDDDDDEIEFAPQKVQPLPDVPAGYERFTREDVKKLNTFITPFNNLRSAEKKYYTQDSENESPFKLMPLKKYSNDHENDKKYTFDDLHASLNNEKKTKAVDDSQDEHLSPVDDFQLDLPGFDGNGLSNDELDDFL